LTVNRKQSGLNGSTYIIVVEEHSQLSYTDTQVGLVKLVGNVPAQRSKLPAFLNDTVEETQAKQQLLPCML